MKKVRLDSDIGIKVPKSSGEFILLRGREDTTLSDEDYNTLSTFKVFQDYLKSGIVVDLETNSVIPPTETDTPEPPKEETTPPKEDKNEVVTPPTNNKEETKKDETTTPPPTETENKDSTDSNTESSENTTEPTTPKVAKARKSTK